MCQLAIASPTPPPTPCCNHYEWKNELSATPAPSERPRGAATTHCRGSMHSVLPRASVEAATRTHARVHEQATTANTDGAAHETSARRQQAAKSPRSQPTMARLLSKSSTSSMVRLHATGIAAAVVAVVCVAVCRRRRRVAAPPCAALCVESMPREAPRYRTRPRDRGCPVAASPVLRALSFAPRVTPSLPRAAACRRCC